MCQAQNYPFLDTHWALFFMQWLDLFVIKNNSATSEIWYKSYRSRDDINVVRLASENITFPWIFFIVANKHKFWYKSYRFDDDINVVCLASQNITFQCKNNMVV